MYCAHKHTVGVPAMMFTIESSKFTPNELQLRIMTFLDDFYHKHLTEAMYTNFLEGLITRKSVPYKDIADEMGNLMASIKEYSINANQKYVFNKR